MRRGWRRARLHDAQMVDDESRVGVAVEQLHAGVQVAPAQDVDRKVILDGGTRDPVEAGIATAVAEAESLLAVPGVTGVNLSGMASARGVGFAADVQAEIGRRIRAGRTAPAGVSGPA